MVRERTIEPVTTQRGQVKNESCRLRLPQQLACWNVPEGGLGKLTSPKKFVVEPEQDRHFRKYFGPSAKVPDESSGKRIRKRNAFKNSFIEFARSSLGKNRKLYAVTFTYPPSASEDSLYGDMVLFARRVAKRAHDSILVVAAEDEPKRPKSLGRFHWHGIAAIGSGKRNQKWFKDQWARRVGANKKAIDTKLLRYSKERESSNFEGSASRWINYCCRAPNPTLPLPIKLRVVASGRLATMWKGATKDESVDDSNFEPHTKVNERGAAEGAAGTSRHPPCLFCRGVIPNARRAGSLFCKNEHKDAYHNAKKTKAGEAPRRPR